MAQPRRSAGFSRWFWVGWGSRYSGIYRCWGVSVREHRQKPKKPSKNGLKWAEGQGFVTPRGFSIGLAPGGYQYTPYQILWQSESGNIGKMAKNLQKMAQNGVFGTSGSYGGFLRLVTGLPFWLGILIPPLLPKRSVFGFLIRPPVFEEQGVKVNFFENFNFCHFGVPGWLSEAFYRVGLLARYTNTPPITY